jgi:hypothetical protein
MNVSRSSGGEKSDVVPSDMSRAEVMSFSIRCLLFLNRPHALSRTTSRPDRWEESGWGGRGAREAWVFRLAPAKFYQSRMRRKQIQGVRSM